MEMEADPTTAAETEALHTTGPMVPMPNLPKPSSIAKFEIEEPPSDFKSNKRPQFYAAAAAAFGFFLLGTVIAWTSPAIPDLNVNSEFNNLSKQQKSWLAAFVPLGAAFGGPIGAYGIGKYGRQRTLLISCFPFTIGWICISLAHSMTMMNFGRFLTGICCGVVTLVMPIYASEFTEESIRGIATSPFAVLGSIGVIFTYAVGSISSWQVLTILSALLPPIYAILLYFLPESPIFLLSKRQKKQAGKALMWFRGATSFDQIEPELRQMRQAMEANLPRRLKPAEYFVPEIIKATIVIIVLMLLQQLTGITSIVFFSVDIFSSSGSHLDPNVASIILGLILLVGNIIFTCCVDRIGRRILLLVSGTACSGTLAILGYFFYVKSHNDPIVEFITWVPLVALVVFGVMFNIGFGPLPWLMMAEIVPPRVKGLTSGIATVFNWMLAFLVTKSFEELNASFGQHGTFWFFATISAFGILFTYLFVPETKGKKLEDIQMYFRGRSTRLAAGPQGGT